MVSPQEWMDAAYPDITQGPEYYRSDALGSMPQNYGPSNPLTAPLRWGLTGLEYLGDVLDRPNRALWTAYGESQGQGLGQGALPGFARGLMGRPGSMQASEAIGMDQPRATDPWDDYLQKYLSTGAVNIAGDPLTWAGGLGLIGKGGKAASALSRLIRSSTSGAGAKALEVALGGLRKMKVGKGSTAMDALLGQGGTNEALSILRGLLNRAAFKDSSQLPWHMLPATEKAAKTQAMRPPAYRNLLNTAEERLEQAAQGTLPQTSSGQWYYDMVEQLKNAAQKMAGGTPTTTRGYKINVSPTGQVEDIVADIGPDVAKYVQTMTSRAPWAQRAREGLGVNPAAQRVYGPELERMSGVMAEAAQRQGMNPQIIRDVPWPSGMFGDIGRRILGGLEKRVDSAMGKTGAVPFTEELAGMKGGAASMARDTTGGTDFMRMVSRYGPGGSQWYSPEAASFLRNLWDAAVIPTQRAMKKAGKSEEWADVAEGIPGWAKTLAEYRPEAEYAIQNILPYMNPARSRLPWLGGAATAGSAAYEAIDPEGRSFTERYMTPGGMGPFVRDAINLLSLMAPHNLMRNMIPPGYITDPEGLVK